MPDGEKKPTTVEMTFQLAAAGWSTAQIAEFLSKEVPDSSEMPETETKPVTVSYARGTRSSQEDALSPEAQDAACATWAESRSYRVNGGYVDRGIGSGGGADA